MRARTIELIYFEGCPHAGRARLNLRAAVGEVAWTEWDLSADDTPPRYRAYGSPTVLVDGIDVTGVGPGTAGAACRADGAPSLASIREALARHG
ncbi:MAG: hypothetical protein AB7T31_17985 [Gemmatimonadales bacterium]